MRSSLFSIVGIAALALVAGVPAARLLAQQPPAHMDHGSHAPAAASPAVEGFRAANARMHRDMDIAYSGNADRDFVAGMIPHHQGAIDMANVVLRHGTDPEIRKMAQEIIAAQEQEIALMRRWQAGRR